MPKKAAILRSKMIQIEYMYCTYIYMASQHKRHITSIKSQTENYVSHQMFLSARDSQIILAAITVVSARL